MHMGIIVLWTKARRNYHTSLFLIFCHNIGWEFFCMKTDWGGAGPPWLRHWQAIAAMQVQIPLWALV